MNWLVWVVLSLAAVFFVLKIVDYFVQKKRKKAKEAKKDVSDTGAGR